ncbi:Gmad2 immunoglobulin-like domain-containing protein [Nocardioides soli]|uniref:GerMN domain-containing protein n=1 Tax=Nocardioides soli TaxID=1036020 RepID=A0A7W4Z2C8_9ACTN|nr:hypothetical protein [Nocardioides soli]
MNDLHDLFEDAVADVEPADRLDAIRCRTSSPAQAARPWFRAAALTVVGTAATVTLVAALGSGPQPTGPAEHGGHEEAGHADRPAEDDAATMLVPAYFVGASPNGPRLYREFDRVPAGDPLQGALERIQEPPSDPDYRTLWAVGTGAGLALESATLRDTTIDVELGPIDLDQAAPELAVQQVVYTLQAAAGRQLPVRFLSNGRPSGSPVDAARQDEVLNPVSISDPAEGNTYAGSFIARGRVGAGERTVEWSILDGPDAQSAVARGLATIDAGGGGFAPWTAEVDLSGLAPGTYVFSVSTADVRLSAYGPTFTDTRTISVR